MQMWLNAVGEALTSGDTVLCCCIPDDLGRFCSRTHHSRRTPSRCSYWSLYPPGLRRRFRPAEDRPDYSRALTPGCHLSCLPWSAVSVWLQKTLPPTCSLWLSAACGSSVAEVENENRSGSASEAHRGPGVYMRRVTEAYKNKAIGRTALYMVVVPNTRGFLLPSSWPLCLCVDDLRLLSAALRKAQCDKSHQRRRRGVLTVLICIAKKLC